MKTLFFALTLFISNNCFSQKIKIDTIILHPHKWAVTDRVGREVAYFEEDDKLVVIDSLATIKILIKNYKNIWQ